MFFDGVGAGASNSTLSAAITIRSLNMTGYINTLTHNAAVTLSIGDGTAGASSNALIFGSLTYTLGDAVTSQINFISTSITQQNVNFNSKTAGSVYFGGVGGSWKLTGTLNTGSATSVNLEFGTLTTNGQTMSIGSFFSDYSSTRSLTLGTSSITLTGSAAVWSLTTTTGLTFAANTSSITLNGSAAEFDGGGLTYSTVNLTGSGQATIGGANTFGTLNRTGTAVKTDGLALTANQTVSSSLTLAGNTATNRLLITSDILGTARTITSNALTPTVSNADFRDITGAGSMSWNLSAITGKAGDCGGNSGITFTTAQDNFWVTSVGSSTGNWSDPLHWASTTGGMGNTGRVPLPQDGAKFDANSIDAGSRTITANMPRLGKSIDWTNATNTPALDLVNADATDTIYGSLTLISGMTITAGALIFEGRSSFTFTTAGKTPGSLTIQMVGGTLTMQDNLTLGSSDFLSLTNGTFAANNKTFSIGGVLASGTYTRTLTMGSGTWTLKNTVGTTWTTATTTNLTFNVNTSTIVLNDTGASAKSFIGGGLTFNVVTFSGDNFTVSGNNTFDTLNVNTAALTNGLKLTAGSTQTISTSFTTNGSSGNLAKLLSTSAGSAASLSKASGQICVDYMSIKDSTATGGATWFAGSHSTNVSGNTGWQFTVCGGGNSGFFLCM